jgi:hypothetical protein
MGCTRVRLVGCFWATGQHVVNRPHTRNQIKMYIALCPAYKYDDKRTKMDGRRSKSDGCGYVMMWIVCMSRYRQLK